VALIHLDAGVIIGFLDRDDAHHAAARAVLTAAVEHGDRLAMAASAYAECLVGPARRGVEAVRTVSELFDRLPVSIVALDPEIAEVAANLRARHRSLRLPDAIVIATASEEGADELVTTDRAWPSARALKMSPTLRRI
jgi:predicted nucleic acid-binding protein